MPKRIPILAYHRVAGENIASPPTGSSPTHTVGIQAFRQQMNFLSSAQRETLLPRQFALSDRPVKPVVLTFDDGHASDVAAAAILAALNYRSIFYVPWMHVGRPGFVTPTDIRNLAQEGFAFGSHGMTHTPFTQLSTTALKSELIESKARLEELLGQVVVDLALPLGRYNHSIIQVALDVGYERIMTSNIGLARLGYSPIYSRIPIFCNTTLATFRMLMAAGPFQLRMLRLWRSLSRRVSPLLSRPRWHTIASGNAH